MEIAHLGKWGFGKALDKVAGQTSFTKPCDILWSN